MNLQKGDKQHVKPSVSLHLQFVGHPLIRTEALVGKRGRLDGPNDLPGGSLAEPAWRFGLCRHPTDPRDGSLPYAGDTRNITHRPNPIPRGALEPYSSKETQHQQKMSKVHMIALLVVITAVVIIEARKKREYSVKCQLQKDCDYTPQKPKQYWPWSAGFKMDQRQPDLITHLYFTG
ncbi:hypothetical protein evm_014692 [Chilo suppressalis]|nr:hypothetical protein evm_014692 [Chilo suppressalis]